MLTKKLAWLVVTALAVRLGWHWWNVLQREYHPKPLDLPHDPEVLDPPTSFNTLDTLSDPTQQQDLAGIHRIRPTRIPGGAHAYGFTVFDNLYLRNGTFYVVTEDPSSFPEPKVLISIPVKDGVQIKNNKDSIPTENELRFINSSQAVTILGTHHLRTSDLTVVAYDPDNFMHHFYHWWGENVVGLWRVYSLLAIKSDFSDLPFPTRFFLPFISNGSWRDRAGLNGPFMRLAFPHASVEDSTNWKDLIKLNMTVAYDRVILVNRHAAHRHRYGSVWFNMIASTMAVEPGDGFWEPVRKSMLSNFLGGIPVLDDTGAVVSPPSMVSSKPIVTYVSRQGSGRRLRAGDHQGLVEALFQLQEEGLCEVHVAAMEKLSMKEQILLISRSTILLGVHGNGLTHQLWMPPSSRSTVIEIFTPQGFRFDYEILTRNMGHRHYAIWNDTYETHPKGEYHKGVNHPSDFHGLNIPVYGPTVASIIRDRLGHSP